MLPRHHPDRIRIAFDEPPGQQCRADPSCHPGPAPGSAQLVDRHLDLGNAPGRANTGDKLMPLFRGAQRIAKSDVEQFQPLDWANARMRALAAETLDQGWWRLLWTPPSLPYHSLAGPYESVDSTAIT